MLRPPIPMSRSERVSLVTGLLLATALMYPLQQSLLDDTYVHLQYARNIAEGQGPVVNRGERVYGCTSPLWATLIADAMAPRSEAGLRAPSVSTRSTPSIECGGVRTTPSQLSAEEVAAARVCTSMGP